MRRGLPLGLTLAVLAVLPILIGLGVWQLRRADWKEALLAQLEANRSRPLVDLPVSLDPSLGFRRVHVRCDSVRAWGSPTAGRTVEGVVGYRQVAWCRQGAGEPVLVNLGISADPAVRAELPPRPSFTGPLVPRDGGGPDDPDFILVAEEAPAPLRPAAPPTVEDIPNNHLAYAGQWFFFALALLGIYGFYVRQWRRA